MAKCYCKWCGNSYSDTYTLTHNTCSWNPNGKYHELYEGSEKSKYTCKFCGNSYSSLSMLTRNTCAKHPNGFYKGYHSPAL